VCSRCTKKMENPKQFCAHKLPPYVQGQRAGSMTEVALLYTSRKKRKRPTWTESAKTKPARTKKATWSKRRKRGNPLDALPQSSQPSVAQAQLENEQQSMMDDSDEPQSTVNSRSPQQPRQSQQSSQSAQKQQSMAADSSQRQPASTKRSPPPQQSRQSQPPQQPQPSPRKTRRMVDAQLKNGWYLERGVSSQATCKARNCARNQDPMHIDEIRVAYYTEHKGHDTKKQYHAMNEKVIYVLLHLTRCVLSHCCCRETRMWTVCQRSAQRCRPCNWSSHGLWVAS
jgi:hypothetical protein